MGPEANWAQVLWLSLLFCNPCVSICKHTLTFQRGFFILPGTCGSGLFPSPVEWIMLQAVNRPLSALRESHLPRNTIFLRRSTTVTCLRRRTSSGHLKERPCECCRVCLAPASTPPGPLLVSFACKGALGLRVSQLVWNLLVVLLLLTDFAWKGK